MKVLSLFDGMACGMLAMQGAGIEVERYVAYEIDKYAVQTSSHNFPMIEHRGDVFGADFTEFADFDFLVGGSPCTYWSIAQTKNRETVASGMGWELFSQYVRALREAQPRYFIYENNKSMAKAIRESITKTFGFEPICINSALVSAQNRQRLYWVGKRNLDGTYSKVQVDQPTDRGILLRDVLDGAFPYRCTVDEKCFCLDSNYWKTPGSPATFLEGGHARANRSMVIEPVACRCRGRKDKDGNGYAKYECREDGKANTLDTNTVNGAMVAEPIGIGYRGRMEDGKWVKRYESNGEPKANALTTALTDSMVSEPIRIGCYPSPDGTLKNSQGMRLYSINGKSVNMTSQGGGLGAKSGLYAFEVPMYAQPIEWDNDGKPTKAISGADGKTYPVFEVKDGFITIKDKQYPIKLADGFYIIRKLTVSECKRLQTVPEWYDFPVSDTQAYKMLGNGWTVDVISHLIKSALV